MQAKYTVIQASRHSVTTEVLVAGNPVMAEVPSLVVQLQPIDNPDNNSVIKLVLSGVSELEPFVVGEDIIVTFKKEK